jgi:hypothetical protein
MTKDVVHKWRSGKVGTAPGGSSDTRTLIKNATLVNYSSLVVAQVLVIDQVTVSALWAMAAHPETIRFFGHAPRKFGWGKCDLIRLYEQIFPQFGAFSPGILGPVFACQLLGRKWVWGMVEGVWLARFWGPNVGAQKGYSPRAPGEVW